MGFGNPILSDDAVGVRLVRDLAARLSPTPELEVVDECTAGGLEILDVLKGRDRVVLVDSILTEGGVPGRWWRFTAAELRRTAHLAGIHDASLGAALRVGRAVGMLLPRDEEIHVFAVEVEDAETFGEGLTPGLAAAYPRLLEEILPEVGRLVA